ncbi:MAG: hydrogenase small subunit [Planctomycetes bacterium]|nr:hydrogenase small subunit [Planctomycetota bacterium]
MNRRSFLEASAGAVTLLGCSLIRTPEGRAAPAKSPGKSEKVAEVPVLWMATGSCSGCSVSLLNSASPTIQEVLLDEVLPGKHVSLVFHATVMAAQGHQAMELLQETRQKHRKQYVLVVEGATATEEEGLYCSVGERSDGRPLTGFEHVRDLSRDALAVLAVGACASFGGIPTAGPNPTGAVSVPDALQRERIETPVVRIPGCPPHPDWIVGTIAALLLGGLKGLDLDDQLRPRVFFDRCIHDNCPYRGQFESGNFAEHFGEHGCLLKLGCKGPITYADCPIRKYNNGTSWCVEAGHPCIGCCHPDFPFDDSLFAPVTPAQLSFPEVYPPARADIVERQQADKSTYATLGMIGVAAFLAGAGVTAAARKLKAEDGETEAPASSPTEDQKEE